MNNQELMIANMMEKVKKVGTDNNGGKPIPKYIMAMFNEFSKGVIDIVSTLNWVDLKIKDDEIHECKEQISSLSEETVKSDRVISQLKKDNVELQYQADAVSQYTRRENIKITGIPYDPEETQEKLIDIVKSISQHIGAPINEDDISVIHRLQTRNDSVNSTNDGRSSCAPNIIIKVVRRNKKINLFEKKVAYVHHRIQTTQMQPSMRT